MTDPTSAPQQPSVDNSFAAYEANRINSALSPLGLDMDAMVKYATSASLGDSTFLMNSDVIHAAFAAIRREYEQVQKLRQQLEMKPKTMGGSLTGSKLPGVQKAAASAATSMHESVIPEVRAVEALLSNLLTGIYNSYHGQAATDSANAGKLRAAASA